MTTEDYCSYELSQLLKEKGFEGVCEYAYSNKGNYFEVDRGSFDEVYCLRPTLQMAMKWLREVHKVFFCVHPDYPISKDYMVEFYDEGRPSGCFGNYPTYEESVEAALKYSLENLI